MIASVVSVHTGRIAPMGRSGKPSAFRKTAVDGPVAAGALGLAGDEQADRKWHGGVDKAVYAYDVRCYAAWAEAFPALRFGAGAMGENLALTGLDEGDVCIGDHHRIGSAVLEVSQPRTPCNTLAEAFDAPLVGRAMLRSGRCGWYYRVVEAGDIAAGDAATLIQRINPDWSIRRCIAMVGARGRTPAEIEAVMAVPRLAREWQLKAAGWLDAAVPEML